MINWAARCHRSLKLSKSAPLEVVLLLARLAVLYLGNHELVEMPFGRALDLENYHEQGPTMDHLTISVLVSHVGKFMPDRFTLRITHSPSLKSSKSSILLTLISLLTTLTDSKAQYQASQLLTKRHNCTDQALT